MTWVNSKWGFGLVLLAVAGAASAATAVSNVNVTLTINKNCTITTLQDVNFGAPAFLNANVDATGSVRVDCTKGTPATVTLGNGANYDTTNTVRRMTNSTDFVSYRLYSESTHTTEWPAAGVSVTGGGVDAAGVSLDPATTLTIYGRVPPQNTNTTGSYTDTVVATVTF